jgi:hypothetical protein
MRRFEFWERLCSYIKACVFYGNLPMLVDGSPTEDINIQKEPKEGDLLTYSLIFLLIVEGLGKVVRKCQIA